MSSTHPWWRDAVIYQIYVRSFSSTTDNGMGDLRGITYRLPHLHDLGVDAIWLTPFYPSPQHDHGYDVADYTDVDPRFGTLDDFDAMLAAAHGHGLRVVVDVVPNHTSSEHPWFQAALRAGRGSPERARYLFRDRTNNWLSVFGGSAWTQIEDGQHYLHLFDTSQPDLDWTNPEVADFFDSVLRFWLDRGVDGFRVDVAHGNRKAAGLPDAEDPVATQAGAVSGPMWDQPEVHDIYRRWHHVLASYDGDRMAVAEAWAPTPERTMAYARADELQQAFNFHWLEAPWDARAFREVIATTLDSADQVGAPPTWVLSNHDVVRHPTRYGGGDVGLARARAATLTMLALPGSAYLYQGEELGLEEVQVPVDRRQDPQFLHGRGEGRDGCRVPIPWSGLEAPYGNGSGEPWLPQPADWAKVSVEAQERDLGSTLSFYRRALRARRDLHGAAQLLDVDPDLVAFRRGDVTVLLNTGHGTVPLPPGDVILASGPIARDLPADTAVWLQARASL